MVGLHDCTGLTNRSGAIGARYRDWGQRLAKAGFVVLFPDSHGSRGLGSQCGLRQRALRVERERVADADAARASGCSTSPGSSPARVSLLGWSNGGDRGAVGGAAARAGQRTVPDFRSAVALYPGCRRLDVTAWSARVPTLILIGRADDQASAAVCQQMVAGARGRSARVAIHVYPGAVPRFRPPEPAAALAHRACLHRQRQRPRPQRHRSGRPRRRAQARAGVARAVIWDRARAEHSDPPHKG